MWRRFIYAVSLVSVLGACHIAQAQFDAFVVQNPAGDQLGPDVKGAIIVWHEYVDDDFRVRGKNLATGEVFAADGPGPYELDPVTNGSIVVWRDKRGGNFDLFAMDLQTDQQWTLVDESHSQVEQAIGEDFLVWKDLRHAPSAVPPEYGNSDIYALDLRTGQEFPVCTAGRDQFSPDISGSVVVWADQRRYVPGLTSGVIIDIYGFDINTGQEFLIAADPEGVPQSGPSIGGNIVVWVDGHNGGDIWGYNLSTAKTFPIHVESPDDYAGQTAPKVDGHHVVWIDGRDGPNGVVWSLIGYDLRTGEEFVIFRDPGYLSFPAISGDMVAWAWDPVGPEKTRIMAAYIPEPASLGLLAFGGALLAARRRGRRRNS